MEDESKPKFSRERLRKLDPEFWTDERLDQQFKQWNYKAPSDPQERLDLARRASSYEHVMRGLNADLKEGRITREEYQKKAQEANQKHFGERD